MNKLLLYRLYNFKFILRKITQIGIKYLVSTVIIKQNSGKNIYLPGLDTYHAHIPITAPTPMIHFIDGHSITSNA